MLTRLVAFLLVLVMFWTGTPVHEQATAMGAPAEQSEHSGSDTWPDGQLPDDPLKQAHAEWLADLPGILPASAVAPAPALSMARPCPYAAAFWLPPYLDGPQRPPNATRPFLA
jgi:hypothetical protein